MPNAVPPVYTCGYSDQPEADLGTEAACRCRMVQAWA